MTLLVPQEPPPREALVAFFGDVLPSPAGGQVFVVAARHPGDCASNAVSMEQTYSATHEQLADAVLANSTHGSDLYFALGRYEPHATSKGRAGRQGRHVCALKSFWVDIDCGPAKAAKGQGYATKRDAISALCEFVGSQQLSEPTHLIDSGGGIHAYWALDSEIPPNEWKPIAAKLKALAAIHGFLADPTRTADMASVMRAPFTLNHKLAVPRDVKIKRSAPPTPFSAFAEAVTTAHVRHLGQARTNVVQLPPRSSRSLLPSLEAAPLPETPEEIERVKSMLAMISADCAYPLWRDVVWSIAASHWGCAEAIAREWSQTAPQKFDEAAFRSVFRSFKPEGGVGFGTLVHHAKLAGWTEGGALGGAPETSQVSGGDIFNGKVFASLHRDKLLSVYEADEWLKFETGTGWLSAPPHEADRAGKAAVEYLRAVAAERWKASPDNANTRRFLVHVQRSSSLQKVRAMIDLAKSEPGMTVRLHALDSDPMVLGVMNGVLDLRTRKLLTPSPLLLVTKRCPASFDPSAVAPTFDAFIKRITRATPTLASFLQRLAGYLLTGLVSEQCFAFLYGIGRNGKTTFAEILQWLMGDYAVPLPTATLMAEKSDAGAARPDLMLLKGRRLALASELEEGAKFAEAAIKAMTGGDTMQARNPYGRYASWTPTHKLMIVGNHKPVISGSDYGMWRRVLLIPFLETIGDNERDDKLLEKLRKEGAGILNWMLAGLQDWQRQGLNPPQVVKDAVADYRSDMDVFKQWMDEHVMPVAGAVTPTADLYKAYVSWAREAGWRTPMTRSAFGRRLAERGIQLTKGGAANTKCAGGIALNDDGKLAASRAY